jgi:hypothetical protein
VGLSARHSSAGEAGSGQNRRKAEIEPPDDRGRRRGIRGDQRGRVFEQSGLFQRSNGLGDTNLDGFEQSGNTGCQLAVNSQRVAESVSWVQQHRFGNGQTA